MKKYCAIFILLSFYASVHSQAQKILPDEITFSSNSSRQNFYGLHRDDVFSVSPISNNINTKLELTDFYFNQRNYENTKFLNLGYTLFEAKQMKKPMTLQIGFGLSDGVRIGNYYSFEESVTLDSFKTSPLVTIDSFTSISAGSYYQSSKNMYFNFGLSKTVLSKGLFSFQLGISGIFGVFLQSETNFFLTNFYSYKTSTSYSRTGYGVENIAVFKEAKNASLAGFNVPLTLNVQLSRDKKFLKNASLVLSTSMGIRYYFHPELPVFYDSNFNGSVALKYAFSK